MGYTIRDKWGDPLPLRLIADTPQGIKLHEPFTPWEWTVDACNPPSRRIEVFFRSTDEKPAYYRWFEVVFPDDSAADIDAKLKAAADLKELRLKYEQARDAYTHVLGRSPEYMVLG